MRNIRWGIVSTLFALAGTDAGLGQEELIRKIINGIETLDYPAVGIVGDSSFGGFCTGTLIDSSHVLTAAHCAEEIPDDTSGTFEVNGQVYQTTRIAIHPDYDTITLENDIALLELSEPVEGVDPAITSTFVPEVGDTVSIVGFGGGGDGETGDDGTFGTKRVGTTMIDEVNDTTINALFDSNDDSNPSAGDSGGPLFATIDGAEVIVGIVSAGTVADASLGDLSINTRIDAFSDWIDETILGTVTEPPIDGPSDEPPSDEPTDDPATDACTQISCCWANWCCFFICNPCWMSCCTSDQTTTEDTTTTDDSTTDDTLTAGGTTDMSVTPPFSNHRYRRRPSGTSFWRYRSFRQQGVSTPKRGRSYRR